MFLLILLGGRGGSASARFLIRKRFIMWIKIFGFLLQFCLWVLALAALAVSMARW